MCVYIYVWGFSKLFGHLHVVWVSSKLEVGSEWGGAVMWQVLPRYEACPDRVANMTQKPEFVLWLASDTTMIKPPQVFEFFVASPTLYEACPNVTSVTYMDLTQQIPRPRSCEVCSKGNRTHKAG